METKGVGGITVLYRQVTGRSRSRPAGGRELTLGTMVRFGHPVDRIRDAPEEISADIIMVGLRHRSRGGKFLLGSHTQELLLTGSCPVGSYARNARRRTD